MKNLLLLSTLLLLIGFSYGQYVNPVMLQEKWDNAKAVDKEVNDFEQSIRDMLQKEVEYQATRKECWFFQKECKKDYEAETLFTYKYYIALLNKLELMKRNLQTQVWLEYNMCANGEGECGQRPARVDLLLHGPEKDALASYAYEISGYNRDFILTILAENNQRDVYTIGVTGDKGICQIAPQRHPHITNHPNFYDPYWQIQKCRELYKGGTRFYGFDVRHRRIGEVIFN